MGLRRALERLVGDQLQPAIFARPILHAILSVLRGPNAPAPTERGGPTPEPRRSLTEVQRRAHRMHQRQSVSTDLRSGSEWNNGKRVLPVNEPRRIELVASDAPKTPQRNAVGRRSTHHWADRPHSVQRSADENLVSILRVARDSL